MAKTNYPTSYKVRFNAVGVRPWSQRIKRPINEAAVLAAVSSRVLNVGNLTAPYEHDWSGTVYENDSGAPVAQYFISMTSGR